MLSDPNSEIIKRFGILNTLTDPDDHPWYGIPFPGSYVIDAGGTIVDKFFESSFMLRASGRQLLRAALGEEIVLESAPLAARPTQVTCTVDFAGTTLAAGVVSDLIVRLRVPEGFHLYGDPVPDGMVATSVTIDAMPGLVVQPSVFPKTHEHTLSGTGETLQIFDGDVTIRVPITHMSRSVTKSDDGEIVQKVRGTVRWQSCDEHTCQLPRSHSFELAIPAIKHNWFRIDDADARTRLKQMIARHSDQT